MVLSIVRVYNRQNRISNLRAALPIPGPSPANSREAATFPASQNPAKPLPVPDQPVTIAEELAAALIVRLLRRGVIDADDIEEMEMSQEARDVAMSLIVEAAAPTASEWRAEKARERFRVVDGGEVAATVE